MPNRRYAVAALAACLAAPLAAESETTTPQVQVIRETKHDTSPPLRDMPLIRPGRFEHELDSELMKLPKGTNTEPDGALQIDIPGSPTTLTVPLVQFDGISAVKAIMACDPAARIVMCSAMGQQDKIVEAIRAGARDFIIKPFQKDRVLSAIQGVLP